MFVILIAVYTVQELSTDSFQEKAERIYVLANESSFGSAYKLADRLQERYPEIEKVCPMVNSQKNFPVNIADMKVNADIMYTERTFFDIFSFKLKTGDTEHALAARNEAVISESFARKAFPDTDPMGQVIRLYDALSVTVTGVMKDIRNSVIPYADILVRIENAVYYNEGLVSERFGNYGETPVFILVKEGADIQAKAEDVRNYFKETVWIYEKGHVRNVLFIPLKEIYFSGLAPEMKAMANGRIIQQGDWVFVMILISVGLLILIFAIINYINLTVAQTGFRAKEIATRRLLGANKSESFFRLILEATILSFISFAIGLLLAFAFESYAGNLLEKPVDIIGAVSPVMVAAVLGILVLLGVITGILPGIAISGAKPIDVVKGSFRQKTKMTFSKFFITFQNAITIALIAASITMILQTNHLIKAPLGYNTTNLINIGLHETENAAQCETLANELKQLSGVKRLAFGRGTPFDGGNNYTVQYDGKNVGFQMLTGDSTFFDMLGIKLLRDNHLSNSDGYYFSEQTLRELGIGEDTPSITVPFGGGDWTMPVAGIIKDVRLHNILFDLRAVVAQMRAPDIQDAWNILVEVQGNPVTAYEQIAETYNALYNWISTVSLSTGRLPNRLPHRSGRRRS
jgi:putative ABC transport system permease protein